MFRLAGIALLLFFSAQVASADDSRDCAESRDFERKIAACSAVIKRQPNAGWAYINRSYAYERTQQYVLALEDGHAAVQFEPRNPLSFVNRAAAFIGLQEYRRAIEDTNRALQIAPRHALAFVNRAYAYERLGDTERAIADYERTLESDSGNQYARNALKRLTERR